MSLQSAFLLATAASLPTVATAAGGFGDPGKNYWMWHGICMFLAWCVVFPIGALLAVFRRRVGETGSCFRWAPNFYKPHVYCQAIGIVLNIVGVALAAVGSYEVYGTGNPFDDVLWLFESRFFPWNRHVMWGVSVIIILFCQSVFGYVHHLIKHRYDTRAAAAKQGNNPIEPWKRNVISWAHVIIGPLAMIVAYLTIVQGLQIWAHIFEGSNLNQGERVSPAIQFGYAAVGLCSVSFAIAYVLGKRSDYVEAKSDDECMKMEMARQGVDGTAV